MEQMMTIEELKKMKLVDVNSIDKQELVDICDIDIDETAPVPERIIQFINQVKNPYCFRVGNVAVKVSYHESGGSFQENFEKMILTL